MLRIAAMTLWTAVVASSPLSAAQTLSAEVALRQAQDAERRKDPACVDLYAWAALRAWPTATESAATDARQAAWKLYQDSLAKMLAHGLKHKRLDAQRGLDLRVPGGGPVRIAVNRNGFPWQTDDFNELLLADDVDRDPLRRYWREPGLGVPLIVVRRRNNDRDFHGQALPFAATALLRPAGPSLAAPETLPPGAVIGVLELYDPLRIAEVEIRGVAQRLVRDTSAPFALLLRDANRDNWQDFFRPGRDSAPTGLRMFEPHQRGKIPVVLVHGLLSDKFTWIPLINDLRAAPWVNARFQIWTFQYATGQPFLQSGSVLRQTLRDVGDVFDPRGSDPAQQQIVLIGHSMGGLISKLQVTYSGTVLWDQFASRPFSELRAPPQQRDAVHKMFFFEPVPAVKRVVFVGTPHLGSFWAQSLYGRVGSSLVRMPRDEDKTLETLLRSNPSVFDKALRSGIPTSIDLLEPDSPLLVGMTRLPLSPAVKIHSIVGNGTPFADGAPADGVVSLDSARHPGAASERFVNAGHSDLPDHPDTVAEVLRILAEHLGQVDAVHRVTRP